MTIRHHVRSVIVLTMTAVFALVTIAGTHAQDTEASQSGNGLRISPIRNELTLSPGQTDTYQIEVTNVSGADINVLTIVNDFLSDDESGNPRILTQPNAEPTPFSVISFLDTPDAFLLKPNETKAATINLNIPEDTPPGGYFGIVRFASGSGASEEGQIALNASVGSILLINVPGEVVYGMNLNFIQARKGGNSGSIFESAPDTIAVSLENTGNSLLKPFGRIAIKDMFGNEVYEYEFNSTQTRANVLPKSSRTFSDEIQNIGRIGKYTIEANLSFGDSGGDIITASTSFWVLPWRLIVLALVVISGGVWFATRGLKMYNRKIVERAKKSRQ